MRAALAFLLVAVGLIAVAPGCSGDDDDAGREEEERYVLEVESLSDEAYDASQDAIVALNRVADESDNQEAAGGTLEMSSATIAAQAERLAALSAPQRAAEVADDLEFQLDSLALAIQSVATDVDVARPGAAGDAARAGARLVLASQSGTAALARALRTVVSEASD